MYCQAGWTLYGRIGCCFLPVPWRDTCIELTFIPDVLIKAFGSRFSRDGLALATTQITAAVLEDLI